MMPAYSSGDNSLAVKLVAFYPQNTAFPTHQAWVMYYDPTNGSLQAVSVSYSFSGSSVNCFNCFLLEYINP